MKGSYKCRAASAKLHIHKITPEGQERQKPASIFLSVTQFRRIRQVRKQESMMESPLFCLPLYPASVITRRDLLRKSALAATATLVHASSRPEVSPATTR